MKNLLPVKSSIFIILFSCFILSSPLQAQEWIGGSTPGVTITRTGNVGIGFANTGDVDERLLVNGHIGVLGDILGKAGGHATFSIFANENENDGSYIRFWGPGWSNNSLDISTNSGPINFMSGSTIDLVTIEQNGNTLVREGNLMVEEGFVVVGDVANPPAGFQMAVEDGIITNQVKVCPPAAGWCDYVFEDDYPRNSIDYIAQHIKKHKHLPNVPSAKEVNENGINIADMDAILLRQIEEMWLHLIDLEQKNKNLQTEIDLLKTKK